MSHLFPAQANALETLPASAAVQVFHKDDESYRRATELNPGLARLRARHGDRLVFTAFPPTTLRRARKRADLVLSRFLWTSAVADSVLLFGTGGAFCGNSGYALADFAAAHPYINGDNLMLVPRAAALAAVDAAIAEQTSKETLFVSGQHGPTGWLHHRLTKAGVPDAPKDVRARFASGARHDGDVGVPFSITGTLAAVESSEQRKDLIEQCPEVKLIFPALSEPGCFGAPSTLDKDRCVNSLCVVAPKASGCRR